MMALIAIKKVLVLLFHLLLLECRHAVSADSAGSPKDVFPYRLISTPARISKGFTSNVQLRCEKDPMTNSKLTEIERIRILKKTPTGSWHTISQKIDLKESLDTEIPVRARGWINATRAEAFLQLEWEVANDDTIGIFKCDVIGFDRNLLHSCEVTTEVELADEKMTSWDMVHFIDRLKEDMLQKVSNNAQKLAEVRNQRNLLNSEYVSTSMLQKWPAGQYGLSRPNTGCPVDLAFYGGDTGYLRFQVDELAGDIFRANETELHLAPPILASSRNRQFFSLHFCVVTRDFNTSPWPHGSFCIHQKGESCPQIFQSTTLNINSSINGENLFYGGIIPQIKPFRLCCTTSGPSDIPIDLPTESPFYLYRYGTDCQQVRNMDITPEVVEFQPVQSNVPVRLDLCYYAKSNGPSGR